jgi:2-oxoglutarate dehydrogenase E2 component (dihydrolipoamide succinyltransferase)
MAIEIRVPTLGESVNEATIGRWFKRAGEAVAIDEPLVELETDKVTVEVPAPVNGVLASIAAKDGDTVAVGALLGSINEAAGDAKRTPKPAPKAAPQVVKSAVAAATSGPGEMPALREAPQPKRPEPVLAPSVRKLAAETGIEPAALAGTGKEGRVTKGDMLAAISRVASQAPVPIAVRAPAVPSDSAREERVRMTRLRQTIARRLKEAQNTAAMLTTFNEVDMSAIMKMRAEYKDSFEQKHGVKLGFMGFFVKACVQALKEVPAVNAEIDGADIVYKNYYHVGVAVGTERGLVVPVVREADALSLAEIEKTIGEFARRARDGQLAIEDMQGGTFTISNGGIYGSLLSTPILNAPQSGILGMHKIEERPVALKGQVVVRPMMYLALSYDHRLVDGREAVTWLVRVKECIEDPARMVLDL